MEERYIIDHIYYVKPYHDNDDDKRHPDNNLHPEHLYPDHNSVCQKLQSNITEYDTLNKSSFPQRPKTNSNDAHYSELMNQVEDTLRQETKDTRMYAQLIVLFDNGFNNTSTKDDVIRLFFKKENLE